MRIEWGRLVKNPFTITREMAVSPHFIHEVVSDILKCHPDHRSVALNMLHNSEITVWTEADCICARTFITINGKTVSYFRRYTTRSTIRPEATALFGMISHYEKWCDVKLDGTCMVNTYLGIQKQKTPKKFKIFVDMDDTIVNYKEAHNKALEANPKQPYPQSQMGFFTNLEPISGAVTTLQALFDHGHEIYFLTAPSVLNPMCYTEKRLSIEKLFGLEACYNLIICNDKSLILGDFLIDDRADSHKQDQFKGRFIQFHPENNDWLAIFATIMNASRED